jgi:hypothetical protein
LADVLETETYDGFRGMVVGPAEVLFEVSSKDIGLMQHRPTPAGQGLEILGAKPAGILWVSPGRVAPDEALACGIRVIGTSSVNTLFEASREAALGLLEYGGFPTEVELRPLAELKQPSFGRIITEALLAERPVDEARRAFMNGLADSVNTDSLRKTIYFLTYDETAGRYRSRFAARYDLEDDIEPYLWNRLDVCSLPTCDRFGQGFRATIPAQYSGGDSLWVNLVLTKPGRATAAHYIVCAHYDAIAIRQPEWSWLSDPAPGADDNATGVAALLECARLVSKLELDIGVTFALFSGEELGLQGSWAFAQVLAPDDSVIGVINLDMVGYASGATLTEITYDVQSKWLSDLIAETASALDPSIDVEPRDRTGVATSDHASFWRVHVPGVMLSDRIDADGDPVYPYYHTLADTLGNIDTLQVQENTRLVVAYLSRFAEVQADSQCDLMLTSGSVEWKWGGRGYAPLIAGDSLTALVRAVNAGGSMREPGTYGLEVWEGEGAGARLVYEGTRVVQVAAGGYASATASWRTRAGLYGNVPYTIRFYPITANIESNTDNNQIAAFVEVMAPTVVLRDLHTFPNPVTDPASATLAFEILVPDNDFAGQLEVGVFDLEGRKVGGALLARSHIGDMDIAIGKNTVDLARVLGGALDLPPGIYVCLADLRLVGEHGQASARAKFAVAR